MNRPITIVGAPSSIGIRPYDDGTPRRLDLAPAALREQELVSRLGAHDLGDVPPPAYRDVERPPKSRPRNEDEVIAYSRELARLVAAAAENAFVLVLGGDCSIVLGNLLGIRHGRAPVGLAYVDAHADFASPQESITGSVASMCLALAVGRGDSPLARLTLPESPGQVSREPTPEPLVRPGDTVLIGRRDHAQPWYGHDALRAMEILDLPGDAIGERGPAAAADIALERLARPELGGFWVHLDADAIDPAVLPAVDSPTPGGLDLDSMAALLDPLVRHPRALGLELTIYDPGLDPDRVCAGRLVSLLQRVLR
ncbi:MAG TPA: arginase family protein [Gemmatimonadota bacterium]|nr:arginase family protein [Gemmatimonadota bacterium]